MNGVKLLLEYRADINATDNVGQTVMSVALAAKPLIWPLIEFLVGNGAQLPSLLPSYPNNPGTREAILDLHKRVSRRTRQQASVRENISKQKRKRNEGEEEGEGQAKKARASPARVLVERSPSIPGGPGPFFSSQD